MTSALIQRLTDERNARIQACTLCGGAGGCTVFDENGFDSWATCDLCHPPGRLDSMALESLAQGTELALSPSEIQSFIDCPRRWGWERLDGIAGKPNQYAELGTAVHAQLERWFKTGQLPDPHTMEGRMAESALHLWPAPELVDETEPHIEVRTEASRYHGFQDLGYLDLSDGLRVVADHKTTGDFQWAKQPDRYDAEGRYQENCLQDDIQANVYAGAAMVRHGVDRVKARWGYILRHEKKRKVHIVEAVLTRADVERVFEEKIDPVARKIHLAQASGKTGIEMEINATSCDKYGGCPHQDRCNLTATERMKSIMSQMTLREKVEAANRAKGINPPESSLPPAPPTGVPAPVAAPAAPPSAPASVTSIAGRVAARTAPAAPQSFADKLAATKVTAPEHTVFSSPAPIPAAQIAMVSPPIAPVTPPPGLLTPRTVSGDAIATRAAPAHIRIQMECTKCGETHSKVNDAHIALFSQLHAGC